MDVIICGRVGTWYYVGLSFIELIIGQNYVKASACLTGLSSKSTLWPLLQNLFKAVKNTL